jgi:hypothetical protein
MTAIIPSVSSTAFTPSATKKANSAAIELKPKNAEIVPTQTRKPNTFSGAPAFTPEKLSPEPANKALSEYLAIQNNERREQLSQFFGLDVYA